MAGKYLAGLVQIPGVISVVPGLVKVIRYPAGVGVFRAADIADIRAADPDGLGFVDGIAVPVSAKP